MKLRDEAVSCFGPTTDEQRFAAIPHAGTLQLVAAMWWHVAGGMENASDKVISSTEAKNYGAVW